MVEGSPEEEVIDSIWSDQSRKPPLSFEAGEISLSITDPIVWFPFIVLTVPAWTAIVVVLPPDVAAQFVDFTLYWSRLGAGNLSSRVWLSLIGNSVGLVVGFFVYTRIYGALIGLLLRYNAD